MNIYSGDVEIFANDTWHAAHAALSGMRDQQQIVSVRGRPVVDGKEDWGGYIVMKDDNAAYQVYQDEGRKLRLPNGEERTFLASGFSNPLSIAGNGTTPFG
jgi:hypothetical protein